MNRIAIIGTGGAGKSTLAVRLGEALAIPVFHLDRLFWKPGWDRVTHGEFAALQREIFPLPRWILDGNYSSTMDLRLEAADTIVFLDLPTPLCLYRVVRRRFRYRARSRPDMTEGNHERLTLEFLHYILWYRRTRRPRIVRKLARLKTDKTAIVLSSPRAVDSFLQQARDGRLPDARGRTVPDGRQTQDPG